MYETLEFYDSNGCDLKEVLKSCIYKYYMPFFNKVNIVMRDSAPDGTYSAFCTDAGYEIYII